MAVLGNTSVIKLDSVGNVSGQGFVKTSSSDSYVLLGGGGHLLLSSLGTYGTQGVQGTRGTQGTQGVQGTRGTQGTQGVQGTKGTQGAQGTKGTQGAAGTNGVQGTNGVVGTQGAKGTQGDKGTQGNAGTQGAAGTRGVQGTQGAKGTQGNAGTQGAAGTRGVQGTQGAKGTQGDKGTQGAQGTRGTQGAQGTQGLSGSSKNLTLKNTSGTSVTYNGGSAVDLSGGTYYSTRSFGITSGGNNLTGGTTGQVLVKINNTNGNWQWSTLSSFGTLTVRSNATSASFTVSYSVASGITQTTTIAANGSGSVPSGVTLSIAIPAALTNNGYTGANPYTYTMTGTSATIDLNYPIVQRYTSSATITLPLGYTKMDMFIVNGGNGGCNTANNGNGGCNTSGGRGGNTLLQSNVSYVSGQTTIVITIGAGGTAQSGITYSSSAIANNTAHRGGTTSVKYNSVTYAPTANGSNDRIFSSPSNYGKGYDGSAGIANPLDSGDSSLYGASGGCFGNYSQVYGKPGGNTGGGAGGTFSSSVFYDASVGTFYGAGGGGGAYSSTNSKSANGYQGIVIIKYHN